MLRAGARVVAHLVGRQARGREPLDRGERLGERACAVEAVVARAVGVATCIAWTVATSTQ